MDTPATYLSLGFVLISIPNLLMILGMVVIFIAALLVPFPHHGSESTTKDEPDE
jgi:hypothetical protein